MSGAGVSLPGHWAGREQEICAEGAEVELEQ